MIGGQAKESLLDSYQDERIGIAKELVKTTDRAFHFVTSQNRFQKAVRLQVFPVIAGLALPIAQKLSFIKKIAFTRISEIGLHYRNSVISKQDWASSFSHTSLQPGDRVPYNFLRTEFTSGIHFHLLIFSKSTLSEHISAEFKEVCQPFGELIQIHQVPFNMETIKIYQQYGIDQEGIYLIRPDSYIAYKSQSLEAEKLKTYLGVIYKSN